MGKGISQAEYQAAVKRMTSCPDRSCANGGKNTALGFCRVCKQDYKAKKEYERTNRRAEP
jgi:hypothetical protein